MTGTIMRTLVGMIFALSAAFQTTHAQGIDIDITGGRESALPITIVPMPYQGAAAAPQADIAQIIAADLARSGQFRPLPLQDVIERPSRGDEIKFPTWRQLNQDFIVVGRVLDIAGGYRAQYELWDVAKQTQLLAFEISGSPASMRRIAHQIADAVYEKILGVRGAFDTRIAYVAASGLGRAASYALMVADADGEDKVAVVRDREPMLSPSWSPDGRRIAFVNFSSGNSAVYIVDITRDRALPPPIARFRGINSAPSFSPDGTRLALSLSRSGNPEIYVMDLASRALTQITNHFGIDTEPVWSADSSSLYFTSDRGGRPQIYRVSASGGEASRVTYEGSYNAKASISFDGNKIAVAQGSGNVYRIALLDRSTGSARWTPLSPGTQDESPSFAPNASMIVYAAREGLYVVSADGRVRDRLVIGNGVREPAWSPYRQR